MAKTILQQLIEFQTQPDGLAASSDDRRMLFRLATDRLMVATDRYGDRATEHFDILLSRTAGAIEQHIRKLVALTLVRAGARDEHVRLALSAAPNPNAAILRRSVVQYRKDILMTLTEKSGVEPSTEQQCFADGTSYTLPSCFAQNLYCYIGKIYVEAVRPKVGNDRADVVLRTLQRGRTTIITATRETIKDEIQTARKMVSDWLKRQAVNDDLLAELLDARAMTEFIFAISARFDTDIATTIRILNDSTFESLAITCKAKDMKRSTFAKIIFGISGREGDRNLADRVLPLFDRLDVETAERVMRFWRVRCADLCGDGDNTRALTAGSPDALAC